MKRVLGQSDLEVSAVGMGRWAIGGVWTFDGTSAGRSTMDDRESAGAIHEALDLGVTFFDTAAAYGCGHSEQVLGAALAGHRDRVIDGGDRLHSRAIDAPPRSPSATGLPAGRVSAPPSGGTVVHRTPRCTPPHTGEVQRGRDGG